MRSTCGAGSWTAKMTDEGEYSTGEYCGTCYSSNIGCLSCETKRLVAEIERLRAENERLRGVIALRDGECGAKSDIISNLQANALTAEEATTLVKAIKCFTSRSAGPLPHWTDAFAKLQHIASQNLHSR
jgi:hypothetical protein